MYWIIGVVVVVVLAVNSWWRRSIARNYEQLIEEITQRRNGCIVEVAVAPRKRKKYVNPRNTSSEHTVLWSTDEGFPIDFSYTKKREHAENIRFILTSVVQDASGNVYLYGHARNSKEEQAIDVTAIASRVKLPMYKVLSLSELLETVCGIRLQYS